MYRSFLPIAGGVTAAPEGFGLSDGIGSEISEQFQKAQWNQPFAAIQQQGQRARRFASLVVFADLIERADHFIPRADLQIADIQRPLLDRLLEYLELCHAATPPG